MNELIKIENTPDGSVVSARELHQFLESKQDFSNWIKNRVEKYSFEEGKDFYKLHYDMYGNLLEINHDKFIKSDTQESMGNSLKIRHNKFIETDNQEVTKAHRIDYVLTLDMAKELSMIENNDKGRQARKYFIECEKKLRDVATKVIEPTEYDKEALKARLMEAEAQLLREKKETLQMVTNQVHKEILFSKFYSDETHLLPLPEVGEKSYSATELASMIQKKYGLNLSANKIGRIANDNGLKTSEYGIFLYDKSKYSEKTVESFKYYEKSIDEIVRLFRLEVKNNKKNKDQSQYSIPF